MTRLHASPLQCYFLFSCVIVFSSCHFCLILNAHSDHPPKGLCICGESFLSPWPPAKVLLMASSLHPGPKSIFSLIVCSCHLPLTQISSSRLYGLTSLYWKMNWAKVTSTMLCMVKYTLKFPSLVWP